ncbi:MAG: isoprenylcysteine carboxylmethyltransferase family protein [Myxococcota bacterium]|nr:isoprenylcysteine carboxylmethyltransferase family protein [Myxococcota bacterium]
MSSALLYTLLMGATALERLFEMFISRRNAAWSFAKGGKEHGQGHFPAMVLLHTGFLLACPAEVWLLDRPFIPWLGWLLLALAVAAQGLRWWCITTLGPRWNTRVIIVPNLPRIMGGPYRFIRHPNYVAVVCEGLILPLIHSAWITAIAFTVLNAWLLTVRIRCEDQALSELAGESHD